MKHPLRIQQSLHNLPRYILTSASSAGGVCNPSYYVGLTNSSIQDKEEGIHCFVSFINNLPGGISADIHLSRTCAAEVQSWMPLGVERSPSSRDLMWVCSMSRLPCEGRHNNVVMGFTNFCSL